MLDTTADRRPLDGVTVVDFGQYIAAPGASQILADLGADVIKVENPAGDQARSIGQYGESIMRAYNRGKKSVVIDLKSAQGLAHAKALIREADVVIQNLRPGAMDRLGLSAAVIRELNPQVVLAEVNGFGKNGPSRHRPGLDIAAQAESGIMSVTGEADREPQRVGFPVVDHATSYVVVMGILTGLFRRVRTGRGDHVEASLLDVALDLQCVNWAEYSDTGVPPTRQGNGQPTVAPAADVFTTSDGGVVVSAYTPDKFARLCEIAGTPELLSDPRFADNAGRVANRPVMLAALAPFFASISTEDAVERLTKVAIVSGAVRSYEQARVAADVVESGIFCEATMPDGESYTIPGLPFRVGSSPRRTDGGHVPALGAHTEEVLSRLDAADLLDVQS
jgi:crotonobetainyl-CoA:carnitine CoA-transferase CaiB-like acyl-CoA transferase